jgi:hypothetical protein
VNGMPPRASSRVGVPFFCGFCAICVRLWVYRDAWWV